MKNKWIRGIVLLFLTGITAPMIKSFYDVFTNNTVGILVTMGVPENQVAFINAIPWLFPIGMFIYVIILWSKPQEYDEQHMSSYKNMN